MIRVRWFDAVRAFGLFLVLGYHLFYEWLPGGFLGVDIFFTFSGFLITAIILAEVRKGRGFALLRFYKRRIQRILIPLFLSIAFTLPFALLISPDFTVGISKQVASALSFTSNWYNIITGSSYEAQLLPPLYIHTWSLALEMQFYLAWGLLCALLTLLAKRVYKDDTEKIYHFVKRAVIALSGVIAVCSFAYMEYLYKTDSDLNTIYFSTFTRFFPFYIGALAAAVWGVQARQDEAIKRLLFKKHPKTMTLLLLAVIFASAMVILFDFSQHKFADDFIYHYGFLFTSVLTVALIYGTHGLDILTPQAVKEPRLLRAAADLSYDIYLFHWPFYVIFSALILRNTAASLVTLAASVAFSAAMVYGYERVLIPGHKALKHKRLAAVFVGLTILAAVGAGGLVVAKAPIITSMEADFAAGPIVQDTRQIEAVKRGLEAMGTSPVVHAGDDGQITLRVSPTPEPVPVATSEPDSVPTPDLVPTPEPVATPEPTPEPVATPEPTPAPVATPAPTAPPAPDASKAAAISGGVTVIGDSVSLGAQAALIKTIPDCYVDSVVARPVSAGLNILTNMQNSGELKEYVVIALGTNGTNNYAKLMTQIIDAIDPGHRVIFVTPFDGRSNENAKILNATAEWMRGLPDEYAFITIADWNALISPQVSLLAGDKVHMGGQTSMSLYADLIAEAVYAASLKPAKE
jgi:peptidoglycan/LPS O-acetylase OafA/YrhL